MTPRINLAPGEKPSRSRTAVPSAPRGAKPAGAGLPRSPAMLIGLVGMVVLLAMVFLYFGERRALSQARAEIVEAEADSAQLHSAVVRVRAMEQAQAQLEAQVAVMENVVEGRLYWIQLMESMSLALPEHTWLTLVDREGLALDQVRIAGASFANAAVTEFMRGLESSPLLEGVTLVGVSRVQEDSLSYQSFTLVADFENYSAVVVAPSDTTQGGQ
jgi:Tfp pilus assembly protein PilN